LNPCNIGFLSKKPIAAGAENAKIKERKLRGKGKESTNVVNKKREYFLQTNP
jgi:hypothetical protein